MSLFDDLDDRLNQNSLDFMASLSHGGSEPNDLLYLKVADSERE